MSYDKTGKLWNTGTGKEVCQLIGHQGMLRICAYSPVDDIVATSGDDKVPVLSA